MILVAGIGNIFLGDDGFGPEVICRLLKRPSHTNVRIVDFGIRGLDLAYALLDPLDAVLIVDATQRGGSPGTLYVIAAELPDAKDAAMQSFNAHALNPVSVLQLASMMGAPLHDVRIVACEAESLGVPDEGRMGLSDCVGAAVDQAVSIVESLIQEVSSERKQSMDCHG